MNLSLTSVGLFRLTTGTWAQSKTQGISFGQYHPIKPTFYLAPPSARRIYQT